MGVFLGMGLPRIFTRQREPVLPEADDAVAPTYATSTDALIHGLRMRSVGGDPWFEPLPANERVGTVDRCLQLTAAQIASMPLRYRHSESTLGSRPAWVSDPDPAWYPNGIADAIFAVVWSIYARGDAFLYATSRYETGWPRTWTVLDAATMQVVDAGGERAYRSNQTWLEPGDVLQISRNP